jgi:2-polyprenyl-3-methyl-5-hydroxy-6-metoxy-1,4-benzoquinol methylase
MKQAFKNIPLLGPTARSLARQLRLTSRKLRGKDRSGRDPYVFCRQTPERGDDLQRQQIVNLLNYTKTSGSIYNGQEYPAGYHTIDIGGLRLQGQRDLEQRYSRIPFDFTGKTVLDVGCNQGGMLFAIADKITHGIGIDYDKRVINAANKIRSHTRSHHLDFFTFDLEQDDIDLIRDLIPGEKVDIAFLLAVCAHIQNWQKVIDLMAEIAGALLFEANGSPQQQAQQLEYLRAKYRKVDLLSEESDDRHTRRLYLAK